MTCGMLWWITNTFENTQDQFTTCKRVMDWDFVPSNSHLGWPPMYTANVNYLQCFKLGLVSVQIIPPPSMQLVILPSLHWGSHPCNYTSCWNQGKVPMETRPGFLANILSHEELSQPLNAQSRPAIDIYHPHHRSILSCPGSWQFNSAAVYSSPGCAFSARPFPLWHFRLLF